MIRAEMVERICAASPCHGRETIVKWSAHWPEDVTLHWLLAHPKRGDHVVSEGDRVWLALRTDLLSLAARRRIARLAVVRACGYVAKALAKRGHHAHAKALRGVTLKTPLPTVRKLAANAANAAANAAAAAAERKKQLKDCIREAKS